MNLLDFFMQRKKQLLQIDKRDSISIKAYHVIRRNCAPSFEELKELCIFPNLSPEAPLYEAIHIAVGIGIDYASDAVFAKHVEGDPISVGMLHYDFNTPEQYWNYWVEKHKDTLGMNQPLTPKQEQDFKVLLFNIYKYYAEGMSAFYLEQYDQIIELSAQEQQTDQEISAFKDKRNEAIFALYPQREEQFQIASTATNFLKPYR